MNKAELIVEIEAGANEPECSVVINYWIPTVAVVRGKAEFFFQGEEASELLYEADALPEVSTENYILWLSRGW